MISDREIKRQFRVLRQTLAIHAMLRDDYSRRVLAIELTLLAASVVFCATTFAGDDLYELVGVGARGARVVLGIASLAAFFGSLVLLRVNWNGLAARHGDAADKWSMTLRRFCEARSANGEWSEEQREALSAAYWETDRATIAIPDKKFNRCKSRYLLKCEISRFKSDYPGCPRIILWAMVRWRDLWHAVRNVPRIETVDRQLENSPDGSSGDHAG